VTLVTFGQVGAHGTAGSTTETGTNGRAISAAQAVADHRTTGRTDTAADGSFGPAALASGHRTARRACDTGANCCAGAAAHFLADDITQRTTQTAAERSSAFAGHCTLSNQKPQNQSRQS
jgi:hypothetical protein